LFILFKGYNPLHLACFGGHVSIVGLLLSRSAELLHSTDRHGKTGLHIAAMHGHYQMMEVLLGQGAEINATDKNGWTPLHCSAKGENRFLTVNVNFLLSLVLHQKAKLIMDVLQYGLQHLKVIMMY
jgi:hypothetical protein